MRAIEEALENASELLPYAAQAEDTDIWRLAVRTAIETNTEALALLRSLAPPPAKELSEEALKQEADASVDMYTDLSQGDKEFRKRSLHLQ